MKELFCPHECTKTEENTCCLECTYFKEECEKTEECCCHALDEVDKGCSHYKRHIKQKKKVKIMDFSQITRDEFMKKYFNKGCPSKIDLEDPEQCITICSECWAEAIKDIKFKEDLQPNKDLFEEKTTLTFKSGLDDIVGKPIKLLGNRRTKEYVYGLVDCVGDEYIKIRFTDESITYSATELAEFDPTILD